jgi:ureidoglycolate lyase
MARHTLTLQTATPDLVAQFGVYIGADEHLPVFAAWPGVTVHGAFPMHIGSGGEVLSVRMDASPFPAMVELLERHFLHAQTYLPANGKPFAMVLGRETRDGMPDFAALRAFVFRDCSGIALHPGTWHEFPLALENDTRLTVILRHEAHLDMLTEHAHPMDARGPDLERHTIAHLAEILIFHPQNSPPPCGEG